LAALAALSFAGEKKGEAEAPKGGKPTIAVAVLDFEAKMPGSPKLGQEIADTLTAILSGEPGFALVERATLRQSLQEHELNLSGLVKSQQAVKIGKLIGARILVTGRAFALGKQLLVMAKVIGTETGLVEGVLVKGKAEADIGGLVLQLGEKLAEKLRKSGPKLVAQDDAARDPLPALKAQLAKKKLPVVAVIIKEEHVAPVRIEIVDPAVETEVKLLLRQCGFKIQDVKQNELADWARNQKKEDPGTWPRGLSEVDFVITGEAFSEFAARIGNLRSCLARAEVNMISRKDGKIVAADRATTRAVDLAENVAGKTALQKAGRALAMRMLRYFAKSLPDADRAAAPKKGRE